MPRPILKQQERTESTGLLSATLNREETAQSAQKLDKLSLDRLLRKQRSKEYMEAMGKLDAGGHTLDRSAVDEIVSTLRAEFPEIDLPSLLIGYIAKCHLGAPYEVHTLDPSGNIIEHYEAGRPLPSGMERARGIAFRGGYAFIEVYEDCARAVSSNGTVSVIQF